MTKLLTIKAIKEALNKKSFDETLPKEWLDDSRSSVQQAIQGWYRKKEKQQILIEKLHTLKQTEQSLFQKGYQNIAGIDEVGRGPLAGPVVAACVIMKKNSEILEVNDSKQLTTSKREMLYEKITQEAQAIGVGIVSPDVIDSVNIYEATKLAMQQAIDQIAEQPDYLLIDAMKLPNNLPQMSLIKGDERSYSIACASIVAKVVRDKLMADYALHYPYYAFEKNAGYGTKEHLNALQQYGVTPIHRRSFEPIKSMLNKK